MNTQEIKNKAREMFDEKFENVHMVQSWCEEMCECDLGEPCYQRIKSFIDTIIDLATKQAIEERDEEVVELIQERINNGYTITKKDIAIPYTDKNVKVILEDLIKDINLITNRNDN